MKNFSSILAIVNHRNWLDDSSPLITQFLNYICEITTMNQIYGGVKI